MSSDRRCLPCKSHSAPAGSADASRIVHSPSPDMRVCEGTAERENGAATSHLRSYVPTFRKVSLRGAKPDLSQIGQSRGLSDVSFGNRIATLRSQ